MKKPLNITEYLSRSVKRIAAGALRSSLQNHQESAYILKFTNAAHLAERTRMQHERAGRHIPAFLISSITAECNLNCNGCYALANQSCRDQTDQEIMPAEKWNDIFFQARKIGVSFILIAGGEPLIRKDVIKYAAGRGFLHINADGGAEPCTFSPYSDISVRDHSLLEVLDSKLFINLRDSGMLIGEHRGGCLLFEKEEYVKDFLSKGTYRRPGGCS